MPASVADVEGRLWDIADSLRANSGLRASEYSTPVLGLIFLRFADHRFAEAEKELVGTATGRRTVGKLDFQARGAVYLPDNARFSALLELPEGENIGRAIDDAMRAIEAENEELRDVLPKTYMRLDNSTLVGLLRAMAGIPPDLEGDAFGTIYEYFLGKFAMAEGQRGGEFFTPTSLVRLIVEIIEPYHGLIFDPACGSGGMFVQSAKFVARHQRNPNAEISIYGQEKTAETVRLCRMNLAVHGLSGDIKEGNTYYEDIHDSISRFDFVMANPPFNVDGVDKEKLKEDPRFPFGLPRTDNANYLWIQAFYSALNETGRAGFVMANSAGDARGSELELRRQLLQSGAVDAVVAIGSNFFYTVTLPCAIWFLDRAKVNTERRDSVLFLDARQIYRQLDRAHRDFAPEQLEFLANVVRLYRGEEPETNDGSAKLQAMHFSENLYTDVPGLCKSVTLAEIEGQGWSMNPGRYVGLTARGQDEFVFVDRLEELNEELEAMNMKARVLEEQISGNVAMLLSHSLP
jgi:type I restriction enzyme M protein